MCIEQQFMQGRNKNVEAMTRQRLEQYQSNKAEIRELTCKLHRLGEGDSLIRSSVILDYKKGYPQPQAVVGYDYGLEMKRRKRYEDRIGKLRAEQDNIEEWVFGIQDGLTQRIFRLYFLDGLSQKEVARKVHLDQSCVRIKINDCLKNA